MTPTPSARGLNRRGFLTALGLSAAAVGAGGALSGCSSSGSTTPQASTAGKVSAGNLPKYVPIEYAKPDFPAKNGSPAGYAKMPTTLVKSVKTTPGTGKTITAMTPLWGTIPPSKGNQYYEAVNKMLGDTIDFQISDGNTYGDKLATVLASKKDVADWVQIPSWNLPARFGSEIVENVFLDLTPHLAGDAVTKYPNLANIPTDAWKACVWNDKLYGLPYPSSGGVGNAIFYRDDLLKKLGITADPKSAQDFLDLAKELTDPSKKQWGSDDPWNAMGLIFSLVPKWRLDDSGKLINRVETPEYKEALEWSHKMFKAGVVHPDAVAGKTDEAKARFQSGRTMMAFDGTGGWNEALRDNLKGNPSYSQMPFLPFGADASTAPVYWKGAGAGMYSFIKKTDDKAKIEELLKLANALAAPFGTDEFQLINYGVEGVHYNLDSDGLPQPTDLAAKEVQPTYIFLVDPPVVEAHVQYPGFVKDYCTWAIKAGESVKEPLFYGMNITEPSQYASIGQPFTDLESDIGRGRKPISALDDAIKEWQAAGGNELRTFYQQILDNQ
ncbi:sugar ABC transporter substrate-binding protein [Microlunatus elymi]|uniref:Sugar ABC transporter substrate-binding protein n=1 Tax=Microlunatus elymi TaxID=2596828 RepID=A0A516PY82_9ACTN|nr:extracellular solute-binding protein [Microlunatus elymi]QDP96135.1 sugar ABC transporter substrate-binding protein [Microlunatus elymi]